MGEVDIGLRTVLLPSIMNVILVRHQFYSYGNDRSGHRSQKNQCSSYNHGGLNIDHPRFTQESIPSGVQEEN